MRRAVARAAPCSAGRRRGARARCRRRWRWSLRVGGDEQLDGVQRAGADLDLLGRVVLDQLLGVDPGDEVVVELEHAVEPQHVRDEVVGEERQRGRGRRAGARPASARSAAAICARLKNGTASPS